jgi:transposase
MARLEPTDDELWELVKPLLPGCTPRRRGRPRVSDRAAFAAIVFVLVTGVPWRLVPLQIGCSGVTAWRRLREWQRTGVWERLHRDVLRRLNAAGWIDWSRGVVDSSHIRALRWGLTGPSPVDRARTGSKHHLLVDASGVPLAVTLTGGNRNDITQLLPLVDGIILVAGNIGRPRQRPDRIVADRSYDHDSHRHELWHRSIKPSIARRGTKHGSGLGRWRWVVERTFAWLHKYPCARGLCGPISPQSAVDLSF